MKEEAINKIAKLVEHQLDHHSSYHNHKETMAHAIFGVELALLLAIFSLDKLPEWLSSLPYYKLIILFLTFFIWLIIHVLLRWQLLRRRWAAISYAGTLNAYKALQMNKKLPPDALEISWRPQTNITRNRWLDYIVPRKKETALENNFNENDNCLPKFVGDSIEVERQNHTPSIPEYILTYGSILVLILIVVFCLHSHPPHRR